MNNVNQKVQAQDVVPLRVKVRREVARTSDAIASGAGELAETLLNSNNSGKEHFTTSQMRQLENVAYMTPKVSDITDLVKNQIGRGRWPVGIGQQVLEALERLETRAKSSARDIDPDNEYPDLKRRLHLLLCREYVHHLVAHFLYASQK